MAINIVNILLRLSCTFSFRCLYIIEKPVKGHVNSEHVSTYLVPLPIYILRYIYVKGMFYTVIFHVDCILKIVETCSLFIVQSGHNLSEKQSKYFQKEGHIL